MRQPIQISLVLISIFLLVSCTDDMQSPATMVEVVTEEDYARGPNDGRLLEESDFTIELAIFETGVPPEFRAWATYQNSPVGPQDVDLDVTLTRLGNEINVIGFALAGDMLRGDTVIYEPHSFFVTIDAKYRNINYHWDYESLEGRTTILPEMSAAFGIETDIAGPATLQQSLDVVGRITANYEYSRDISARFDGLVQSVEASIGDFINQGDNLVTIESNQSLIPYTITAPISGVITQRNINPGEQSNGQTLLTIMDTSNVWADLSIFPGDRSQVQIGAPVTIYSLANAEPVKGIIDRFNITVGTNQTIIARVAIENRNGLFSPGTFVEGKIKTGEIPVPLAVKRTGLQPFRDFTVVYAKFGNDYEVRMLELGRQDEQWIEVLGGLNPDTEYVSENSYILKADIEKSGASHDH
jgi:cobalt-zinc-cadmium efflux system membrane fusion protein